MATAQRLFDFLDNQVKEKDLPISIATCVDGKWESYSSKEFSQNAYWLSNGLIELGIGKGDKIAVISHNNRSEWNIADMGVLQLVFYH